MNVVEVKFDDYNQTFYFKNNIKDLKVNLTVVVDSERGYLFGKVVNIINDIDRFSNVDLYDVVRISNKRDYLQYKSNLDIIDEALEKCRNLVAKSGLSMNVLDASYNLDRSQLLFRFVSDERVDFRQLAKDLGSLFKTRIELRQVGIRDKAKEVGGIGPCGRKLCCSSFLNSFDSITINMAKTQNVSLNPSKINGVCGRLLCCLKYENDNYADLRKDLPVAGKKTIYKGKDVKVISVDVLKRKYFVELEDKSIVEVKADENKK